MSGIVSGGCGPSHEEIAHYKMHGWVVTGRLFDEGILDRANDSIRQHQAGQRDVALPPQVPCSDWKVGDGPGVRNNEFASIQTKGFRELAWNAMLGEFAAGLAETSQIRLFDDQAIVKPSANTNSIVGWHTDHSYWSTCTSNKMLTAWIPLADTTEETGTLTVVDGSHLWPEAEHVRDFNNTDLNSLEQKIMRQVPETSLVHIELKKGQVSFHHMRTLHASSANTSGRHRMAIAVHLQDRENRYNEYRTEQGELVQLPHDFICKRNEGGLPDYTDPAVFPVLWDAEQSAAQSAS